MTKFNMFAVVARLMVLRHAIETDLQRKLHLWEPQHGGGETGRKWNDLMEEGWTLDLDRNGLNCLTKTVPDYNETQMAREVSSCGWHYMTGETLLERADREGETHSVSIASRRLRRQRARIAAQLQRAALKPSLPTTWTCEDSVSVSTGLAIDTLSRYGSVIRAEGEIEQQEIFETQMMRMGEHDTDIMEWRDDFETWPTFPEQLRSKPRFNRHQRSW